MKIVNLHFKLIFFLILGIFSLSINFYYANIGVFPIDTFAYFDTAFNILNGKHPFKDTWVTVGPLLDYIQAGLFKLFGVSWFTYVLHGSLFNIFITISVFIGLTSLGLKSHYSFLYSLSVAILCYPLAGTPFADQHSIILSIVSLILFYAAIKTKKANYWFLLPLVMGFSFFCKQVPSAYINLIILIYSLIYFLLEYNLRRIIFFFLGSVSFLIIIIIAFLYINIPINNFLEQYILFPLSLGEYRAKEFYNFSFRGVVGHFKFIYLFLLIIIIALINQLISKNKKLNKEDLLIYTSVIISSFFLIFHQKNIFNQTYIFFIIPIIAGVAHNLLEVSFKKNKFYSYLIIAIVFLITCKYHYEYNEKRKFMDLQHINFKNAINAQVLDKKLNNLKWITPFFEGTPENELSLLKESFSVIKNDSREKMVITHYQFISVLIDQNTNTPNRWYTHNNVSYPLKNHKYYEFYKNFLINKIESSKIKIIYIFEPLNFENFSIFINENCVEEFKENLILKSYTINNNCKALKKL